MVRKKSLKFDLFRPQKAEMQESCLLLECLLERHGFSLIEMKN